MMTNEKRLVKILNNISVLLQIKGENPFKARAYSNAAEKIRSREVDIYDAYLNKSIHKLQGFGEALVKKINEYFETGKIAFYENLIQEIPESVAELTKIKNIGLSKVKQLYYDLKISNLEELEDACINNKLIAIKGISNEIQEQILISTQHRIASRGRLRQEDGYQLANRIIEDIHSIEGVETAILTSDCRRFIEEIKEFVFFIQTNNNLNLKVFEQDINHLLRNYKTAQEKSIELNYIISNEDNAGWNLHLSTGNQEYLNSFNAYARTYGFDVKDDGLYKDSNKILIKNEEELFKLLNLQYIPAELRESAKAIDKANKFEIPNLIRDSDLKGLIHVHSNWSDGKNTIEEMALKARELGFLYIAICDHSRSAGYTGGLSIERVKEQHREIDILNKKIDGIDIIKGIESDILPDGSLDYPDEVLKTFDIVVASIHSNMKMGKAEMTKRIIKAIQHPNMNILGHPTGRLILSRRPYEIDIIEVIKAAADFGKVIEINANPYRLDLSWENVIIAKDYDVRFSINPDSHNINTFTDVRYGVQVARKGWLEANDVVNTRDVAEFLVL